jgi:hypothetical protein
MMFMFRYLMVIALVLLQTFAPLVHAHASDTQTKQTTQTGLHLPGLEGYSSQHNKAAMFAFDSVCSDVDGLVISIDTGIKNRIECDASHSPSYLPTPFFIVNPSVSPFQFNFSPQSSQFIATLLLVTHSPRAPPLINPN